MFVDSTHNNIIDVNNDSAGHKLIVELISIIDSKSCGRSQHAENVPKTFQRCFSNVFIVYYYI